MISVSPNTSLDEFKQIIEQKANPLLVMFLKEVDAFDCFCQNVYYYSKNPDDVVDYLVPCQELDGMLTDDGSGISFEAYPDTYVFGAFKWQNTVEGRKFWHKLQHRFNKWYRKNWESI